MRPWTQEDRARQADLIRQQKPWEKSTGPKTEAGKRVSSLNSLTHGHNSQAARDFKAALHEARKLIALARELGVDG